MDWNWTAGMIFSANFIPLIWDGTVKEKIASSERTNPVLLVYHHRLWGNIVAKNVDYLIHSILQTMTYYSENYAEHKYCEHLVSVAYKCKISNFLSTELYSSK